MKTDMRWALNLAVDVAPWAALIPLVNARFPAPSLANVTNALLEHIHIIVGASKAQDFDVARKPA